MLGNETYSVLLRQSILCKRIALLDWFARSVETCPAIIAKTVRWNIKCFECQKILIKETDNWGKMESRFYEDSICSNCARKHHEQLKLVFRGIPCYEI